MSLNPLKSLGYWRGKEIAIEGFLPVAISGYCIWKVKGLTSALSISKPFTTTEILVFLGALFVEQANSKVVFSVCSP